MKFSTGKGSGMKHATGLNMQKLAELKRRIKALKHSTGGRSSLAHATGKEMDYKVSYEELLKEEEKLKEKERKE